MAFTTTWWNFAYRFARNAQRSPTSMCARLRAGLATPLRKCLNPPHQPATPPTVLSPWGFAPPPRRLERRGRVVMLPSPNPYLGRCVSGVLGAIISPMKPAYTAVAVVAVLLLAG